MAHMNKAVAAAAELSKWAGICQQAEQWKVSK